MDTTCFETVHASVSLATSRCHSQGGLQMKTIEQVYNEHHQMSLARSTQVWCTLRSALPDLSWEVPYDVT